MAERFVYSTGTISIETGASAVTGAGTAWGGRDRAGSCLYACPAGAGPVLVGVVAEADPRGAYDDLALPLVAPYNGAALEDADYVLVDGAAIANGATQAAIYARFAAHLEQNMGLAGNDADDIDFSLVPNNSLIVDHETKHIKQWRNGVFEDVGNGVDGATIFMQPEPPVIEGPFASLWIDSDSDDLDVHKFTGAPPGWEETGVKLKGTPGINGLNGASALTVVRTAATANVDLAIGLENGDTVSGVVLATNDVVLLAAQTAPAENGVYVVPASGAAARHASFATYDSYPGCYFSVCEGAGDLADTLWRCTSDRGGTLGTTALAFSQFSSGDVAGDTHAAASKSTPVDADEMPLSDSAATYVLKKLTWANLKTTLASWLVSAGWIRDKLTANRTYYVRTDGNDANDGLTNTSGGAFATIQKAYDLICSTLDLGGKAVTIQMADGTYTSGLAITTGWSGGGSVTIQGNTSAMDNVVVALSSGQCFAASGGTVSGVLRLRYMKIVAPASGYAINMSAPVWLQFANLNFAGTSGGYHIACTHPSAYIQINGGYTISGGANAHIICTNKGQVANYPSPITVTLSGTPAFASAFVYANDLSWVNLPGVTWSGSATGSRYQISGNAVIDTQGAGTLPGSSAGTASTGGQYI